MHITLKFCKIIMSNYTTIKMELNFFKSNLTFMTKKYFFLSEHIPEASRSQRFFTAECNGKVPPQPVILGLLDPSGNLISQQDRRSRPL